MRGLITGLLVLSACATAAAQEWIPIDARSRALGGAGVAFADGRADSLYWNPAALAVNSEKVLDFSTGFSFSLSESVDAALVGDIAANLNNLVNQYDDLDLDGIQTRFDAGTVGSGDVQSVLDILDGLSRLNDPGQGVLVDVGAGLNIRVGPFGIFARGLGNMGGVPIEDLTGVSFSSNPGFLGSLPAAGALTPAATALSTQLQLANPTLTVAAADSLAFNAQQSVGDAAISDPAFFNSINQVVQGTLGGGGATAANNQSGILLRALVQAEIGMSFAIPVLPTLLDVGISLKYVITETSFTRYTIAEEDDGEDIGDTIQDELFDLNRRRSTDFNIDLGVKLMPVDWLSLGLAGRNLIPMDHEFAGPGGDLHQDPQVRFGAMARFLGFIRIGFDVDVMENESPVLPGYFMQHLGGGVEFDLYVLKLRLGYADNIAAGNDHERLTAGIGLDLFGFVIDIGAQMALHEIVIKPASATEPEETIPTDRAGVGISIGLNLPF